MDTFMNVEYLIEVEFWARVMRSMRHALFTSKPRWVSSLAYRRLCPFHSISKEFHSHAANTFSYPGILEGKDQIAIANALSLSGDLKSYSLGTQIHSHVIKLGFCHDVFSRNNLIKMYCKVRVLCSGMKVFEEMAEKNLVSWTIMVSGAIQNFKFKLGLKIYVDMLKAGLKPNEFALGSVVKACTSLGAHSLGSSIHCFALKIAKQENSFVGTAILNMYAELGDIDSAELVFEHMNSLDTGFWNAMVGGYVKCGCGFEALKLLSLFPYLGLKKDKFTFINALKACSVMGNLDFVKQIHGLIIQTEERYNTSIRNALMDAYFKNDDKDSAMRIFNWVGEKDIISWNTVFSGFSQDGNAREIVNLYHNLMITGRKPNNITFSVLLRKCGQLLDLNLGLQFYCLAIHFGFCNEANIINSLINMFSRCRKMDMAYMVFDSAPSWNINTWSELISGYNINCYYEEGIKIFIKMRELGVGVDECTFSSSLEVCCKSGKKEMGKQLHCDILKSGFHSFDYVCSSLIKFYATLGILDDCYEFNNGPGRLNLVSWGTMISSLVHHGLNHEATGLLQSLMKAGQRPDNFILASILNGCASNASYWLVKSVHTFVIQWGYSVHAFVASALIDAYAKCSDIEGARVVFDQSFRCQDVVIYNTMIMAYAHQGLVAEAMDIFEKMKLANLRPSQATFISLISACSHCGLISLGCFLFKSMGLDYGLEAPPEIYGCLVDMLSRNGYLEEAKHIIEAMPFPAWPAICRSLLSGCRIYGNRALGEWATGRLLQLFPENDVAYELLLKLYSEEGSWEDAAELNRKMIERGVAKSPGYSWIET